MFSNTYIESDIRIYGYFQFMNNLWDSRQWAAQATAAALCQIKKSAERESDPRIQLGKLTFCH